MLEGALDFLNPSPSNEQALIVNGSDDLDDPAFQTPRATAHPRSVNRDFKTILGGLGVDDSIILLVEEDAIMCGYPYLNDPDRACADLECTRRGHEKKAKCLEWVKKVAPGSVILVTRRGRSLFFDRNHVVSPDQVKACPAVKDFIAHTVPYAVGENICLKAQDGTLDIGPDTLLAGTSRESPLKLLASPPGEGQSAVTGAMASSIFGLEGKIGSPRQIFTKDRSITNAVEVLSGTVAKVVQVVTADVPKSLQEMSLNFATQLKSAEGRIIKLEGASIAGGTNARLKSLEDSLAELKGKVETSTTEASEARAHCDSLTKTIDDLTSQNTANQESIATCLELLESLIDGGVTASPASDAELVKLRTEQARIARDMEELRAHQLGGVVKACGTQVNNERETTALLSGSMKSFGAEEYYILFVDPIALLQIGLKAMEGVTFKSLLKAQSHEAKSGLSSRQLAFLTSLLSPLPEAFHDPPSETSDSKGGSKSRSKKVAPVFSKLPDASAFEDDEDEEEDAYMQRLFRSMEREVDDLRVRSEQQLGIAAPSVAKQVDTLLTAGIELWRWFSGDIKKAFLRVLKRYCSGSTCSAETRASVWRAFMLTFKDVLDEARVVRLRTQVYVENKHKRYSEHERAGHVLFAALHTVRILNEFKDEKIIGWKTFQRHINKVGPRDFASKVDLEELRKECGKATKLASKVEALGDSVKSSQQLIDAAMSYIRQLNEKKSGDKIKISKKKAKRKTIDSSESDSE